MKTIQELADIGAKAAKAIIIEAAPGSLLAICVDLSMSHKASADSRAREAFAQAVADEVAKDYQESLAKLEWRPVSVKPTKEDADSDGYVCAFDTDGELSIWHYNEIFGRRFTHWRPASPPPQQVDAAFESWWGENPSILTCSKDEAFKIWKSAREAK